MVKSTASALLAVAAVVRIVLAACSSGTSTSSSAAARLTSCPSSSPAAPGGAPSGAPSGGTGAPNIPIAKAIAPSDTSTSIVIDGSGPQIQCGKTPLTTYRDLLYDTPTSAGKPVPLKLDLQVPKTPGKKPLVVYITGGRVVLPDKSGNLNQRPYLAEQGYVVASIEYRTVPNAPP